MRGALSNCMVPGLNANGQTYDTLRHYAQTIDLEGIAVKTVHLERLLLTKQTKRDKDVADRSVIERAIAVFRQRTRNRFDPPGNGTLSHHTPTPTHRSGA
jgi:hypothetical protein